MVYGLWTKECVIPMNDLENKVTETIKIKKSSIYMLGFIILLVVAGFLFFGNSKGSTNNSNVLTTEVNSQGVQEVTLSFKDYNYYPNTIKVQSGKPVSISLDNSVSGCFRDFTIREFGIREYLETPQDSVVFTPENPGTYTFACSMGMGYGKLIVE